MRRLWLGVIAVLAILASSVTVGIQSEQPAAAALSGSQFDAGNIISDVNFYNGAAMSVGQVQDFLAQEVPHCLGTCLVNYAQSTPTMAASAYCTAYSGSGSESASSIIARVGAACNISQKVLLVLLQKEQGLVTATNPSAGKFTAATGFGCPDSAPCDPSFGGFFYQIYYAARQFQNYAANPTHFNYRAGLTNQILYSPNTACGSGPVFIEDKATAGLYDYTPYQPNAAALANLSGTGDGCSSYGNRNFWVYYNNWFGSTIAASTLVRTAANPAVYLVSGDYKYPVTDGTTLTALFPLGPVAYVSQALLDSYTTEQNVGRTIRSPDGTIYFYDAGIKLPISSCAQAVDYGASCASTGYVQLTAAQIAAFTTGPTLTNVLGTTAGSRYYIHNGTKAEILDDQSQALAGIPAGMVVLTESAVANLPLVAPITRDGVFILTRGTSNYSLLSGGTLYPVDPSAVTGAGVSTRSTGSLSSASLAMLPSSTMTFTGILAGATAGSVTMLTAAGQYGVVGGGITVPSPSVPVPDSVLSTYPSLGTIGIGSFIKSPTNATVYVVMQSNIRPISAWAALLALTPTGNPQILTVSSAAINLFPIGPMALTAGTLVRSPTNPTVYFVNGVTSRIALSSFDYSSAAGFTTLTFVPQAYIDGYTLDTNVLTYGESCGTTDYVSGGGNVHLVSPALLPLYPFTYVPMDQFTCAQLKIGTPATNLIRTPDGAIFELVGGKKLPVSSMARLAQIANGAVWMNVPASFAAQYPTGPLA
jgi:hypothetical protein